MKQSIELSDAIRAASDLVNILAPACLKIEVAGSVRRGKPNPSDIELVATPRVEKIDAGLFGDQTQEIDLLRELTEQLLARGEMAHRLDINGRKAFGDRFKRLLWGETPLDLFSSKPDGSNYGLILMIRTGPSAFSNALVMRAGGRTHDGRQGMLPRHLLVEGGELRYRTSREVLPTPDEAAVWRWLGLQPIPPKERR